LNYEDYAEGLLPAWKKGGSTGYIDASGKVVILFRFQLASPFVESQAMVSTSKGWGMIDKSGRWIVPPGTYERLWPPRDDGGLWAFRTEEQGPWGLLDRDGRVIVQPSLRPFQPVEGIRFADALCLVKDPHPPQGHRRGSYSDNGVYLDNQGRIRVRIPKGYSYAEQFSEGLARVWRPGDGYGFMDKTGKVVIQPRYDDADDFLEGLAAIRKDDEGPWGYIDRNGEQVIPMVYGLAGRFSEGLAAVERDGKWGYIDKTGKMVLPLKYGYAWPFLRGVAKVVIDKKIAFIDKTGKVLVNTGIGDEYF